MSIRSIVQQQIETLSELRLAAEARYWDGLELLTAGRFDGGIYLLGYAAEMHLKVPYFRSVGLGPADPISLGPVRKRAARLGVSAPLESYHNPEFWCDLLLRLRSSQGRPVSARVEQQLWEHASRVYSQWCVDMRYRGQRATIVEAETLHQSVVWIRDRLPNL